MRGHVQRQASAQAGRANASRDGHVDAIALGGYADANVVAVAPVAEAHVSRLATRQHAVVNAGDLISARIREIYKGTVTNP